MSEVSRDPNALIEVYATHSVMDVQIVEDVLRSDGIESLTRKIEVAPMPMTLGGHGEHRVSVAQQHVDRALGLIRQAIADGAVSAQDAELLVS